MKYMSCGFIQHGIEFRYDNEIRICSQVSHIGGGRICLLKDFNPKKFDINQIMETRNQIIDSFKQGNVYPNCKGCMDLKEYPLNNEYPKIKILMLQYWTKCNSKCIYCYTNENKEYYNSLKNFEIYPILKEMYKKNVLDVNGSANFSGGEVSCLKEFHKVVKFLDKLNYYIIVNSSGIKYEKIIEDRLKKGNGCIIISVDAGTKKVHEQIKQVKSYDKVWANIKRYAKHQCQPHLVNIKYIIIPGINDKEEEINLWLDKCKEAGVNNVVLGIDVNYFEPNRDNIHPHIFELFNKTRERAENMGFTFYIANRATTMLTKGKYADPFWEKYRYDDGPYTNIYFEEHRI